MKAYAFLKSELADLAGFFKSKIGYLILTSVLETLRAKVAAVHPDWVLPTPTEVLAAGGAMMACHTLTDWLAIVKTGKLDAIISAIQTDTTMLPEHKLELLKSIVIPLPSPTLVQTVTVPASASNPTKPASPA